MFRTGKFSWGIALVGLTLLAVSTAVSLGGAAVEAFAEGIAGPVAEAVVAIAEEAIDNV